MKNLSNADIYMGLLVLLCFGAVSFGIIYTLLKSNRAIKKMFGPTVDIFCGGNMALVTIRNPSDKVIDNFEFFSRRLINVPGKYQVSALYDLCKGRDVFIDVMYIYSDKTEQAKEGMIIYAPKKEISFASNMEQRRIDLGEMEYEVMVNFPADSRLLLTRLLPKNNVKVYIYFKTT